MPVRLAYMGLGLISCGLGYVGIVMPGMPATVFFLIALWAFKRSSPRFEHWVLYHSPVASILQDWERDRSLTMRTKIIAISAVWVTIGISLAILVSRAASPWLIALLAVTAVTLTGFLASRRTKVVSA
jgi:hypothetical protein